MSWEGEEEGEGTERGEWCVFACAGVRVYTVYGAPEVLREEVGGERG